MLKLVAVLAMLIAGIVMGRDRHGFEHRYAIVNDADAVIVGRAMFESYERTHSCMRVESKTYPKERVIVRLCYV